MADKTKAELVRENLRLKMELQSLRAAEYRRRHSSIFKRILSIVIG
jgi:L-rhamnose mutarotase